MKVSPRSPKSLIAMMLSGLLSTTALPTKAQTGLDSPLRLLSPEYEAEAGRLRGAAPQQYDFSKALLADVLRFLATDAGLSFFSLPDGSEEGSRMITFSINASPFQVLETLCKANGLALIPDNGIWYIRPADDKELIGKSYEIRHNPAERVEKVGGGGATTSSTGGSQSASAGIDLQGGTETFDAQPSEIIQDIRAILDLENSVVGGAGAVVAGAAAAVAPLAGLAGAAPAGGDAVMAANSNELSAFRKPKVIWKSDSNTLYIVATRLQHMWVEGYLAAADKPQPLIAIEVKFIETSKDPKREFGIDWTGTLGQNGTFRQVDGYEVTPAEIDPTTGIETSPSSVKFNYQRGPNSSGGYRTDLSDILELEPIKQAGTKFFVPELGVLSAQDLSFKLRAFMNDEDTKTTSYPRMVTLNNREVAIRSVVNQPVLAASSSSSLGAGATTTSSVEYLPIGTVLNILPKRMQEDRVLLSMSVTVSSIVGQELIAGNPYPIASSRVYNAPVEVNSGYTIAVGGLNEARERETEQGVPVLGKIPVVGWLFKHKSKAKNQKDLMLFITPTLIDAKDGGLPDEPQSVVPLRGPDSKPGIPKIDGGTGALVGGPDSVRNAVDFMKRETEVLSRTVSEGLAKDPDKKKLSELKVAVAHLDAQVASLQLSYPHRATEMAAARQELRKLNSEIFRLQRELFVRKFF